MISFAFGIPAYRGQVSVGHIYQAVNLGALCAVARRDFSFTSIIDVDSCFVDFARNRLLYGAIGSGADWLLMMDSDVHHQVPGDLLSMLSLGHSQGAAVIAPPCKKRKSPSYMVERKAADGSLSALDHPEFRGEVVPVDRIATSCMAIRCGWIVKNWPDQPWFTTQHLPGAVPSVRGEDYSFCDGVRSRGGTILADGRFEPTHVGAS